MRRLLLKEQKSNDADGSCADGLDNVHAEDAPSVLRVLGWWDIINAHEEHRHDQAQDIACKEDGEHNGGGERALRC